MIWDRWYGTVPPGMEPHLLNMSDYNQMVQSGAAFARQFKKDDHVLDMVDEKILKRRRNRPVPGAWCSGRRSWWMDPCSQWGDVNILKAGPQAKKFEESITNLLDDWNSQSNQCKWRCFDFLVRTSEIRCSLWIRLVDLFARLPSIQIQFFWVWKPNFWELLLPRGLKDCV